MAILKCKMCGGTLELNEGDKTAMCAYCGNRQTVPSVTDEVITNLFNRANNLRLKSEFDKAAEIYGKILNNDDKISEAHWGLVLCKYGIEYVEDPKTYKRIPTCHRTQYVSVLSDADYLAAIENADAVSRELYIAQAHEIAELQRSILAIVKDEKPFDVFICYKETDESGKRTIDSTIANDIYYQLTKEGLRVFYSAITLEDKLGVEYEPYIFAALNSAKVMLVIGTKPEYFEAVWVKNEWSRYLAIMKNDREKLLIPCYRDMDAYDLPEEFAHLQAQDMSKIGFINDVVRGIGKVVVKDEPKKETVVKEVVKETVTSSAASANPAPLLKRAFMFLEDGDWESADEYAEKVLDLDPECAEGYLVKLMSELKVRKREALRDCADPFGNSSNYQKVIRFGNAELKKELETCVRYIKERNENARQTRIYNEAVSVMNYAKSEADFRRAAEIFEKNISYKDSLALRNKCIEKAKKAKNDETYEKACNILSQSDFKKWEEKVASLQEALAIFHSLNGWRDSAEKITLCEKKIEEIKNALALKKAEEERETQARVAIEKKKQKRNVIILFTVLSFFIITMVIAIPTCHKIVKYEEAERLVAEGREGEAYYIYYELGDYKDSEEKANKIITNLIHRTGRNTFSVGDYHIVAVKNDGTVLAAGENDYGRCNVFGWTDIVEVSIEYSSTVGLKSDGTVVTTDEMDQNEMSKWHGIVSIASGNYHTVGLKSDGTVVVNNYYDVSSWCGITAIAAGSDHTVGLKADGTVVAICDGLDCACDVSSWSDIVAISASDYHIVGVKSDGTVVATGCNNHGECNVSNLRDIVKVEAGTFHTVALKSDGTVVIVGSLLGDDNISSHSGVVAISADFYHTGVLKANGTIIVSGDGDWDWDYYSCGDVSSWTDIKLP